MCVGHTHMLGCPSPAYTGGLPAGTVTTQDILATEHQVTLLYVRLMMQSVPHRQSVVSHIVWVMFHMVWVLLCSIWRGWSPIWCGGAVRQSAYWLVSPDCTDVDSSSQ